MLGTDNNMADKVVIAVDSFAVTETSKLTVQDDRTGVAIKFDRAPMGRFDKIMDCKSFLSAAVGTFNIERDRRIAKGEWGHGIGECVGR